MTKPPLISRMSNRALQAALDAATEVYNDVIDAMSEEPDQSAENVMDKYGLELKLAEARYNALEAEVISRILNGGFSADDLDL